MIDIAGKLFPNVLTLLTQLCATGVIFLMYRKFLHQPVLRYLENRQRLIEEEYKTAERLKESNSQQQQIISDELSATRKQTELLKYKMIQEIEYERAFLLAEAQKEASAFIEDSRIVIERERQEMMDEIKQEILAAAIQLNEKVLSTVPLNENEIVYALERELQQYEAKH